MILYRINALRDRWANLHPYLRFLIIAAVAAVGLFAFKPCYRIFKSWRMERNLVEAREALDGSRMGEARDLSLTVLNGGETKIEACRILEESMASLGDPRHADIARMLFSHPDGSDEDRWKAFRSIASEAPLGLAGQAWTQLSAELQKEPRFADLFADRLISEKRGKEAALVLLEVPETERKGEVNQRLTRVLIDSGKSQAFDEAQRLIASHFPTEEAEMSAWLDLLESIPAVSLQAEPLDSVRKVLENPALSEKARPALMLSRLDYAADFGGRAAVIDGAIARWKDREPAALAKFLRDLGLDQRLLETFPPEQVESHPDLFKPLMEAIEAVGAWDESGKMLDLRGTSLPKFEELGHRAIIASKTKDAAGLLRQWSSAIDEAKSSRQPDALLKLQRMGREAGMSEQADQALVEAIRIGRGPLPLYSDLKPLLGSLAAQGKESVLLEICETYLSFESGNPVLLTQYGYLACLNNLSDIKTVLKALEPLAKAFPKEVPIQCVLATAYLCEGQSAKAAATLDPLALDPATLAPGYLAAFLTTQVLNGRLSKDDPSITDFPWKSLQPSERRKFSELIQSAAR